MCGASVERLGERERERRDALKHPPVEDPLFADYRGWLEENRAKQIVLGQKRLSARDAIHLAAMEQHGISRILSFDSGFDGFPGVIRLS